MKTGICFFFLLTSLFADYADLPPGYHIIYNLPPGNDLLEMEDGSQWQVCLSESLHFEDWNLDDHVTISANYLPFSPYHYYINNHIRGACVLANLMQGPYIDGIYTNTIQYFDEFGKITLMDQKGKMTTWEIEPKDLSLTSDWNCGHGMLIGFNDNYFASWTSNCKYILINVEKNRHVRANQF